MSLCLACRVDFTSAAYGGLIPRPDRVPGEQIQHCPRIPDMVPHEQTQHCDRVPDDQTQHCSRIRKIPISTKYGNESRKKPDKKSWAKI